MAFPGHKIVLNMDIGHSVTLYSWFQRHMTNTLGAYAEFQVTLTPGTFYLQQNQSLIWFKEEGESCHMSEREVALP